MNGIATTREDITCKELVELVTAYLEDALPEADRTAFAEHLEICGGCAAYVEQIRMTIAAAGSITEQTIAPAARTELMETFRNWHNRGA
jgi:anti-sigma factor RsiW